jgi:hypothetical protein
VLHAIFFGGFGLFLILQSIFNWEFFYNKYRYNFEFRVLGKFGVRVIRFIFGALFVLLAWYSVFGDKTTP